MPAKAARMASDHAPPESRRGQPRRYTDPPNMRASNVDRLPGGRVGRGRRRVALSLECREGRFPGRPARPASELPPPADLEPRIAAGPRGLKAGSHRALRPFEEDLVDVAPGPVLARLERADEGVVRAVEVLGGVLVLRRIAAADVAAGEAEPEVDPAVPHLEALLATVGVRGDVADLVQVVADGHRSLLLGALAYTRRAPLRLRVVAADRPRRQTPPGQ